MSKETEGDIIEDIKVNGAGQTEKKVYKKIAFVGEGGYGRCYKVEEISTKKIFALKIISRDRLTRPKAKQ